MQMLSPVVHGHLSKMSLYEGHSSSVVLGRIPLSFLRWIDKVPCLPGDGTFGSSTKMIVFSMQLLIYLIEHPVQLSVIQVGLAVTYSFLDKSRTLEHFLYFDPGDISAFT